MEEQGVRNVFEKLQFQSVKPEQMKVVKSILERDVFVVLPTGYGKSACFQCLPLIYEQLQPQCEPAIVVVVVPLVSIMQDQVSSLTKLGIRACCICGDKQDEVKKEGVIQGQFQLVYITPERLLENRTYRQMLLNNIYSKRLRVFVIDEAHTIIKWGETFRLLMLRIGEIRSLLPDNTHIMALTATATSKLRRSISRAIGMQDELVVSKSPCKNNIIFSITESTILQETFLPVANHLMADQMKCPRSIIYCRSYLDCANIYSFFKNYLKKYSTTPPGAPDIPGFRLVDMYMSCTEDAVKDKIVELFTTESCLRVVVATVAFGMGIDCRDVRQVFSFGLPSDVESYIQEVGRIGRDGLPSLATLIKKKTERRHIEKEMKAYANSASCLRDSLYSNFDEYLRSFDGPLCMCCSVYKQMCTCSSCCENYSSFILIEN